MSSTIQKNEIIKQVANITGSSVKDTKATVNTFLDQISKNLKTADKVAFVGFGSFIAKNVPARKGRNPQTGEELTIAARRQVRFSIGSELKKKING